MVQVLEGLLLVMVVFGAGLMIAGSLADRPGLLDLTCSTLLALAVPALAYLTGADLNAVYSSFGQRVYEEVNAILIGLASVPVLVDLGKAWLFLAEPPRQWTEDQL